MDEATLHRYARAIVGDALRLGRGDVLAVHGEPAHRNLMVALAEEAYRAGAAYVDPVVFDPRIRRARVLQADIETLGDAPRWHEQRMRDLLRRRGAIVTIAGPADPGLLAGAPPERVAREQSRTLPGRLPYLRAVSAGTARFCVVSWPNEAWAARVYPELEPAAALAALERDVASFARIAPGDADGAWGAHVTALADRAEGLTGWSLRELRLRGPGTDLRLGLPEGALWQGGTLEGPTGRFSPNVPTEEVFTSPSPGRVDGTFACTRPLELGGRTIEGLNGSFSRGRLERLGAARDDDRDYLAAYLGSNLNGDRLGEVALVDGGSRVARAGRTYGTTLLDENAASHIAFGSGFAFARAPGAQRPNRSPVHLDVMIGADDVEVTGIDDSGREVPVLAGGAFA
jgi:aminopeptidase